jgi:signal transduction histidine kinase
MGRVAGNMVQTGESFWAQQYPFFLQRYGFLEETYFDISYDPIRDETGAVGGIFCIVSDQSRRVISERRLGILRLLAAQTSSYKTISAACIAAVEVLTGAMRDVPFALLYLVEDGTPQLVAKSGVSVEEGGALLMPLLGQVLTDGAASLIDDLERYFEVAPAGVWEGDPPRRAAVLPIRSPSGAETVGVLVCGVSPRLAYDEEYSGFLALVVRHIAASIANAQAHEYERHRAEALAEMDHAKNEFFANVSHEFRTPLTLMLNPLQDLIQSGTLDMDQEETLDLAHRNGLRLLKLVNTLLDFSQTQAERAGASFSPTDLAQFTADLASSFRSLSEQAGLKYVIDCPPLPEPIYIDREMWEKIVLNLLSNAFKFTFTGEIRVSVRLAGEFAVMQVQDTGVGIAADELPRIFERFHRVRESRSRTHEGTGIGLALVQELVRLHNGTVDAESTPDVGTTFTVTIPRGSAHLPPDRVRPAQDAPPTVSRSDTLAALASIVRCCPGTDWAAPADRR